MIDQAVTEGGGRSDWPAITAVFVLVIGFTYSDDIVEFFASTGPEHISTRWAIVALDLLLVAGSAVLKWHMTPPPRRFGEFLQGLLRGLWPIGAAVVLIAHLLLVTTAPPGRGWAVAGSPWLTLLTTTAFVAAMGLLLVSALGDGSAPRGWIVPVVIGTFVVQLASAMWYPIIDVDRACTGDVSTEYFNGMVQVLPVFLVTLGLEVNYLRRSNAIRAPGQRAVAVMTVILLCVAEALAFSMLIRGHRISCGWAADWHEYIAFVATVHAAAISLATLAWLLLAITRRPA
ncbi:MAG: hypothetical protein WCP30_19250 [Mycobacteriaceae bacterium]